MNTPDTLNSPRVEARAEAVLEKNRQCRSLLQHAVAERTCLREECAAMRQEIKAARERTRTLRTRRYTVSAVFSIQKAN